MSAPWTDYRKEKGLSIAAKPLSLLVPRAGLEPARYRYRQILSLMRLPVSPPRRCRFGRLQV